MQHYLIWQIIFYFMIYSFLGWILEIFHRSISQRRFVNAGFLYGPFLPLYGTSSVAIILLYRLFENTNIVVFFIAFGIVITAIEYITGSLSEQLFHLRLWDYRNSRFNIRGRVCLSYSLIWSSLAVIFIHYIHPLVSLYVAKIESLMIMNISIAFIIYIFIDLFVSIVSLQRFRTKITFLFENYLNLENIEIEKLIRSIARLLKAFPDLNKFISNNITDKFKNNMNTFISGVNLKFHKIIKERKPAYAEYYDLVSDILANTEFQKLKNFSHHNSSIYNHVVDVSYVSYEISKYLNLDFRAATRGALLHDFFLYDWSNHDEPDLARNKFHGFWHPRIALKNAKKEFALTEIEEDIIIKHMWPLTPIPPRYRESFIVTFADKYVASRELLSEAKKRIKDKIEGVQ